MFVTQRYKTFGYRLYKIVLKLGHETQNNRLFLGVPNEKNCRSEHGKHVIES